jgi:hypothetical protein
VVTLNGVLFFSVTWISTAAEIVYNNEDRKRSFRNDAMLRNK